MSGFLGALSKKIVESYPNYYSNGLESLYPYMGQEVARERDKLWWRKGLDGLGNRVGLVPREASDQSRKLSIIGAITDLSEELDGTYSLLSDSHSKSVLVEMMAYRALGPSKVKLRRNDDFYNEALKRAASSITQKDVEFVKVPKGGLDRFDLSGIGFPLVAHIHLLNVVCTFLLEQYRYSRDGIDIGAREGDIVIDGGGCWGDTALYLANKVGSKGRVISFEFGSDNLRIFRKNLGLNPDLAACVEIVEKALWDNSDETLQFEDHGPGSRISDIGLESAQSLTIDDLVERNNLPRVDFIKMDIEGAEPKALKGATRTLTAFKPRLAITVYHNLTDFVSIPAFLNGLDLGYRFYMDHFSVMTHETVLFAVAD